MKAESWITAGALLAALAVACGAFGAHGLKAKVSPEQLAVWKTAADYHLWHSLGLLLLGLLLRQGPFPAASWAAGLLLVGTLLFSGSLYALVLSGVRGLGAITPIGGSLLIAGWLTLAFGALRHG